MSIPVIEIVPAQQAPATLAQLYVSPASTATRIDKLTVSNPGGSVQQISIYLVPSGQSAGASNITTPPQSVGINGTFNSPNEFGHYLNPGDSIWAIATAASQLVIAVAGTQVVG